MIAKCESLPISRKLAMENINNVSYRDRVRGRINKNQYKVSWYIVTSDFNEGLIKHLRSKINW